MLNRIILIQLFLFSLCFTSCNEKSGSVFPLKENSSLNYVNEAPRKETENISVRVVSVKKENNFTYAGLSSNPFFGKKDSGLDLKINETTGEIYTVENGVEALLIPEGKNLRKGYSWEYNGYNAVVSSENETVKAEKQTFENCIRIDYRLSITFNSEIWIKPGVGIVRFAAYRTNPPSLNPIYYVWSN